MVILFNAPLFLAAFLQVGVRPGGPVVSFDYATLGGASTDGLDQFLRIPYARPPIGDLRFRRPRLPLPLPGTTLVSDLVLLIYATRQTGTFDLDRCSDDSYSTAFGNSYPRQNFTLPQIPNINFTVLTTFTPNANAPEDCTRPPISKSTM